METRERGGVSWPIGTQADVAWIRDDTTITREIIAAIPPIFEAYATVVVPAHREHIEGYKRAVLDALRQEPGDQRWWLGYLETGANRLPFPDAPRVDLYARWPYVLVLAGPTQAASWDAERHLPDLIFPADHIWLVSHLWDDTWHCVGGRTSLVDRLLASSSLETRVVALGEDATPPGHVSY